MIEGQEKPRSDLGVRTASAVVMVAVAGSALWLGGLFWQAFAAIVGIGVFVEWMLLAVKFEKRIFLRLAWAFGGAIYIGCAATLLGLLGTIPDDGVYAVVKILLAVIFTDIGAYAAGRTFGGTKIAPLISPSKTWSGLGGGMIATAALGVVVTYFMHQTELTQYAKYVGEHGTPTDWGFDGWLWGKGIIIGCGIAVVAQAGDFFQSWMKRRAGVKDSGKLLPGHGGLFDRVDGLIAVLFVIAIMDFGIIGSS